MRLGLSVLVPTCPGSSEPGPYETEGGSATEWLVLQLTPSALGILFLMTLSRLVPLFVGELCPTTVDDPTVWSGAVCSLMNSQCPERVRHTVGAQ